MTRLIVAMTAGAVALCALSGCVNIMGSSVPLPIALIGIALYDGHDIEKERADRRKGLARKYADHYEKRQRHAERVVNALQRYGREGTPRPPEHASALVASGVLKPKDFVAVGSQTVPARIAVAHTDLATLATLPAEQRWAAVRAAADALPEGVVAHRLGDLVFVYHGIRPALASCGPDCPEPASTKLWWVVVSPDPQFNGFPHRLDFIWLGAKDVETIYYQDVTGLVHAGTQPSLYKQNRLRRSIGLAELPDPAKVLHGHPAAAPSERRQGEFVRQDDVGW